MIARILPALLLLISSLGFAAGPQITVNGETLRGKLVEGVNVSAFLGVPFAAAPVGDLRWQGPQKHESTHDVRDASQFAPACMQKQRIVDWYRDLAELFGNARDVVADLPVSEDCLYLNVWSPAIGSNEKLPVMVYVHGGSNRSGWSWEPNYHGHALAQHGVVVVSIAYRLGDFGFFAHPELDQPPVVANFGLWDQVAALQWVQDHIAAFGGDADRITLFGESSGAENIVALMFAEDTDDLFQQVILQSTAGFGLRDVHSLVDEQQRGVRFAAALGDGAEIAQQAIGAGLDVDDFAEVTRYTYKHLEPKFGKHFRFDEYCAMNLSRYMQHYLTGGWGIEGNMAADTRPL